MRISFKKAGKSTMGPFKPVLKKTITKKPAASKPNTTSVTGERMEKKITPGGMYKIKNQYDKSGSLVSSDTSRTIKGVIKGAPRKGGVTRMKMGGSTKKK